MSLQREDEEEGMKIIYRQRKNNSSEYRRPWTRQARLKEKKRKTKLYLK